MSSRIGFVFRRLQERLWVKPLAYCLMAVLGVFVAHTADYTNLGRLVPTIDPETIEKLLSIIAASMLAVATFAVTSMISAYGSASRSATPRAFSLVVADDVSQTALSSFIGAFIFSIVALIALKTGYYEPAGHFALFVMILAVFAWVVLTFVRWVDKIARLGRVGETIDRVEHAAQAALTKRKEAPTLGGLRLRERKPCGRPVHADRIGYVQHINMRILQAQAERLDIRIAVAALQGTFGAPGRALAYVKAGQAALKDTDMSKIAAAFLIEDDRSFDEDPRFGLIVLSEIAARALSPAVNDPGTAISILGSFVRLFASWSESSGSQDPAEIKYDRVYVPALSLEEMFDDAFTAIARDGAGSVEVGVRLQKAFLSLASLGNPQMAKVAKLHSHLALERAKHALQLETDIERLKALAAKQRATAGPHPASV